MKLIPVAGCAGIAGIACVPFLIGLWILNSTKAPNTLQWTRDCVFSADRERTIIATCSDYTTKYYGQESAVVAALAGKTLTTQCRAFRARGMIAPIILECDGSSP